MDDRPQNSKSTEPARTLLVALFDGVPGVIELRPIVPDGPAHPTFHETVDCALSRIAKLKGSKINVYVGMATRRDASSGEKVNLRAVRAFWVDIDDLTDPAAREAAEKRIAEFPLKPSMIVWSGGGLHLYWLLVEPVDVTDAAMIARIESILKGLADVLGGDRAATDASRILRVPSTINYPDAKKRVKGRIPARCELIERTDTEYTLDDFDAFELRGAALTQKNGNTTGARVEYESTGDSTLPDYIAALMEIEPELRARFNRRPGRHADHSPSGIDGSLACMLAHWGIPPADIERTLRASRAKAGLFKHDRAYTLTVERAVNQTKAWAREREERAND